MTEEASLPEECGLWSVFEHSVRVRYTQRVLTEIDALVVDGFNRVRRGGVELGGVLFGVRNKQTVNILAFRPMSCEHALGPSFVLSNNDHAALADLLKDSRTDVHLQGLVPVGWYHSHTRSHIHLTSQDIELFDRYFPQPWQIALVLRPDSFAPTRAGFFFREEDGRLRAESSYREFSLPPRFHAPPPATEERPIVAERAANKSALTAADAPARPAAGSSLSGVNAARRNAAARRPVCLRGNGAQWSCRPARSSSACRSACRCR